MGKQFIARNDSAPLWPHRRSVTSSRARRPSIPRCSSNSSSPSTRLRYACNHPLRKPRGFRIWHFTEHVINPLFPGRVLTALLSRTSFLQLLDETIRSSTHGQQLMELEELERSIADQTEARDRAVQAEKVCVGVWAARPPMFSRLAYLGVHPAYGFSLTRI